MIGSYGVSSGRSEKFYPIYQLRQTVQIDETSAAQRGPSLETAKKSMERTNAEVSWWHRRNYFHYRPDRGDCPVQAGVLRKLR
jgi:hypothetical protein